MAQIYTSIKRIPVPETLFQNSDTLAISHGGRFNAAGDLIGPNGRIIKTYEDFNAEYNRNNPQSVVKADLTPNTEPKEDMVFETPQQALQRLEKMMMDEKAKAKRK
jgi:hypothetical protein